MSRASGTAQSIPVCLFTVLLLAGCPGGRDYSEDVGGGTPDSSPRLDQNIPPKDGPGAKPDGKGPQKDQALIQKDGPGASDGSSAPGLANITMFVNLGDSLAAGYYATSGLSYKALLLQNNNALYPKYKGKDLKSLFPSLKVLDKSKSGAVTKEILAQGKSISGNPSGNTLVVISASGNDFNNKLATMTLAPQTIAAANSAAGNLKSLYQHFGNKTKFPGKVTIAQLTIYDSTDGKGTIPKISGLTGFCKTIQGTLGVLFGSVVVANLGTFNQILLKEAKAGGVVVVDNHKAFLGHGFNYQDKTGKYYRPSDPTLWFHKDCTHGNNRGHQSCGA